MATVWAQTGQACPTWRCGRRSAATDWLRTASTSARVRSASRPSLGRRRLGRDDLARRSRAASSAGRRAARRVVSYAATVRSCAVIALRSGSPATVERAWSERRSRRRPALVELLCQRPRAETAAASRSPAPPGTTTERSVSIRPVELGDRGGRAFVGRPGHDRARPGRSRGRRERSPRPGRPAPAPPGRTLRPGVAAREPGPSRRPVRRASAGPPRADRGADRRGALPPRRPRRSRPPALRRSPLGSRPRLWSRARCTSSMSVGSDHLRRGGPAPRSPVRSQLPPPRARVDSRMTSAASSVTAASSADS